MENKIYTLDEIELVNEDSKPIEKEDLTELEQDVLFNTIMTNQPLRKTYYGSSSLTTLKTMFDKLYIYTDAQWEYVKVNYEEDVKDMYNE